MRAVSYIGAVSLDGFLAGVDGSVDWLHFSSDVNDVMTNYWRDIDTVLMGRKTYVVAAAQGAPPEKKAKPKRRKPPSTRTYVFSRTLKTIDDAAVELVRGDAVQFVKSLKQRTGKGICLMGGGELAQSLLAADLIDSLSFNIHPILLGSGIPAFRDPGHRLKLTLTESKPIAGGCVIANYQVVHAE